MSNIANSGLKDHYFSTFVIFLLGFVSYAFFALHLTIVGDDWTVLINNSYLYKYSFQMGRWAHALLTGLFNMRQFAPSFTFFFLLGGISIANLLILDIFNFKKLQEKLLFSALFVSFPIWYEVFIFNMGRIPKSFGLVASVLSAYLLIKLYNNSKNDLKYYLIFLASILLGAFSIGCYQIYILFAAFIINCHFLLALKNWSAKEILRNAIKVICWLLGVVVFYYLITKLFAIIFNVEMTGSGNYSISIDSSNIGLQSIADNFLLIFEYYTKGQLLIPLWIKLMSLFSVLFFCFYFIKSIFSKTTKPSTVKVIIGFLGLFLLIVGPWILGFIREGDSFRYNSLSHLSISFAFLLVFLLSKLTNKNLRLAYISLLICAIGWMSFTNSAAAFGKYLENKRDFALSEKLLDYIHESPNYSGNPKKRYNVYFVGKNPYQVNEVPFDMHNKYDLKMKNLVNTGIWDGQMGRMKTIFKILGEPGLNYTFHLNISKKSRAITEDYLQKNMLGDFESIKNWPHKNSLISLKNSNDFVVVFSKKAIK